MPYPKRGTAPTNTIKLIFDFDTLDSLKAYAAKRKVDITRCAYELIQEGLGLRQPPKVAYTDPNTEPDEVDRLVMRGIDQFRNYKPPRNA